MIKGKDYTKEDGRLIRHHTHTKEWSQSRFRRMVIRLIESEGFAEKEQKPITC